MFVSVLFLLCEKIYLTNLMGHTHKEYDNITINSSHTFYSTTKQSQSQGSWYFEITHKSGNSRSVAGFRTDDGEEISVTEEHGSLNFYYIFNNTTHFQTKHLPLEEEYVYGLGVDIVNRLFLIRHNQTDIKIYKFPDEIPDDRRWNVMLRCRGSDTTDNVYDINFGYKQFCYEMPEGFTPWSQYLVFHSCKYINNNYRLLFAISLVYSVLK